MVPGVSTRIGKCGKVSIASLRSRALVRAGCPSQHGESVDMEVGRGWDHKTVSRQTGLIHTDFSKRPAH